MFDKHSDFVMNKFDKDAIVCPSVTGIHTRLTREAFSSEEEFLYWKKLSDGDYKNTETAGRDFYDHCISLAEAQRTTGISAEDAFLAPLLKAEQKEQRTTLLQQVKNVLTEKQYRRLRLYLVDGLSMEQVAQQDGVTLQSVSECLQRARERIVNNL